MKVRNLASRAIGVVAVAALSLGLANPAQAAPTETATDAAGKPVTLQVGNRVFDLVAIEKGVPYVVKVDGKVQLKPEAARELDPATLAVMTDLVATSNALPKTTVTEPPSDQQIASPCTRKIKARIEHNRALLFLPSCLLNATGNLAAAAGAISGVLIGAGLTGPVTTAVVGAILAEAAILVALNAYCDIFGPGNGLGLVVYYTLVPPGALPPRAECA